MADTLGDIERKAFQFLNRKQWAEARHNFEQMLAEKDIPLPRRVRVLKSIAGTYYYECQKEAALATAHKAIGILETSDFVQTEAGSKLKEELGQNVKQFQTSGPPIRRFWFVVVFIAGIYLGIAFVSGGVQAWQVLTFPPAICLLTIFMAERRRGRPALRASFILYLTFCFGFVLGYSVASTGVVSFGYHKASS